MIEQRCGRGAVGHAADLEVPLAAVFASVAHRVGARAFDARRRDQPILAGDEVHRLRQAETKFADVVRHVERLEQFSRRLRRQVLALVVVAQADLDRAIAMRQRLATEIALALRVALRHARRVGAQIRHFAFDQFEPAIAAFADVAFIWEAKPRARRRAHDRVVRAIEFDIRRRDGDLRHVSNRCCCRFRNLRPSDSPAARK